MILFKQIELLERMHKFIEQSHTGTPEIFARHLGISVRRLFKIIEEMKDLGAPIDYSRKNETYYYTKIFEVSIVCSFRCLSCGEQENISAGEQLFFSFLFADCFVQ